MNAVILCDDTGLATKARRPTRRQFRSEPLISGIELTKKKKGD